MVILTREEFAAAEKGTLWRSQLESDACGVGFVAAIAGTDFASHKFLADSRTTLERMSHRGACGCDDSGDGAGILTAILDNMSSSSSRPTTGSSPRTEQKTASVIRRRYPVVDLIYTCQPWALVLSSSLVRRHVLATLRGRRFKSNSITAVPSTFRSSVSRISR